MKWISVKEKLPPNPESVPQRKTYLVKFEGGCDILFYVGLGNWRSFLYQCVPINSVTHWVELPED